MSKSNIKISIFTGTIILNQKESDPRQIYILERLKYLVNYNLLIEVITPKKSVDEILPYNNLKYTKYRLIYKSKYLSAAIFSLNKLIKLNCDMIHCYSHQAAFIAIFANFFRKKKYSIIFEPMGLAYEEAKFENTFKIKLFKPFTKTIEKLIFKKSCAIIVYTNSLREFICHRFDYKKHIYVVPHGTNLNTTFHEINKNPIFQKAQIPSLNKIILYAGSLSKLNGTLHLINAINYILNKKQDVTFIILGDGPLKKTFEKNKQMNKWTNVFLLGHIPQEEVPSYLKLADILVIPHSKCEQTELDQPTKLFEYLNSGKPIVSFDLKAIAEVVGKEGAILVKPENPQDLANGILRLLNDENLAKKLGDNGKNIAKKYSWEESAKFQYEVYMNVYKQISRRNG